MTAVLGDRAVRFPGIAAWLPVILFPATFGLLSAHEPRWVWMWAVAFGIYAGLKWLSFAASARTRAIDPYRSVGYLLLWPGMDAKAFLDVARRPPRPTAREWTSALVNVTLGSGLLPGVVPLAARHSLLAAGWVGIVAIGFVLHFGLFKVLSLCWRAVGIEAVPIMNAPCRAVSVSEFWGRRWNLAFRDLANEFVFRPLVGTRGAGAATVATFLVSGVIHEVVISGAAGAGFGLPTLYFAIQAAGLFVERTTLAKRLGLGRRWIGWIFCIVVTVGPVGLLFHRPFIERVVVPMLRAFGLL
jgi:Membrane bound O-acyl transferase family